MPNSIIHVTKITGKVLSNGNNIVMFILLHCYLVYIVNSVTVIVIILSW